MIKFQEIQIGDFVIADNDGDQREGEVTNLNRDEKQVCVNTGTQDFWYEPDQLNPIALDEAQLLKLQFHKNTTDDGSVKYMKGAFRIQLNSEADFSKFEIWYRDERRHVMTPISVHNLQNHFLEMTKVHLNEESFG